MPLKRLVAVYGQMRRMLEFCPKVIRWKRAPPSQVLTHLLDCVLGCVPLCLCAVAAGYFSFPRQCVLLSLLPLLASFLQEQKHLIY